MFKSYKSWTPIFLLLLITVNAQAQKSLITNNKSGQDDYLSAYDIYNTSQAIVISDSLSGWDYNWVGNINGSQSAFSNYSQGGVNTLSVTASTIYNALYRKGRYAYGFATDLRYGKTRIADEGIRKTDDRIAVNNKFSYRLNDKRWNVFGKLNFQTQFDQGFDYDVAANEDPILLSEFFSPAYLSEIAGIGFMPNSYFTAEAGAALKQTFVENDSLSQRYGLAPGDNLRFEPGFSVKLGFSKEVLTNVKLTSSLGTFTNLQRSIDRTDVTFSTQIIGAINKFLNLTFDFESIYDDDFSKQLQVKEVLSAGVTVSIL